MDPMVSATWINAIASALLVVLASGFFVAVGAYKFGKAEARISSRSSSSSSSRCYGMRCDAPWPSPPTPPTAIAEVPSADAKDEKQLRDKKDAPQPKEEKKLKKEKDDESEDSDAEASSGESEQVSLSEGEQKKNKKEMEKKVKSDDWEWPVYDEFWNKNACRMKRKLRKPEKVEVTAAPFEVTYEQERGLPDLVTVKLRSKYLIQVAKKFMPEDENLAVEHPQIEAKDMFHALSSFTEAYETSLEDGKSLAKYHLKHLLRFLNSEFKDTVAQVARVHREKKVSWNMLWAFFPKGQRVYYTCQLTGQTLQGIVRYKYYYVTPAGNKFRVDIEVRDYNSKRYTKCYKNIKVDNYKGEKSFDTIGICPMDLLKPAEAADMESMFLHNGKKFYNIAKQGHSYLQYQGSRLRMELVGKCWQLKKQKADGRVMVDLMSFARMNPAYPLDNASPPKTSCCSSEDAICSVEGMPSDEELMLAPAVVYGFSFSNKLWGCFDINGFTDIQFDDQAFDRDLVLSDPSRKEMLLALVSHYLRNDGVEDLPKLDPISNKGDGCIFLCYGPPGTGKTLTAESMAEKLRRPLWSISVFELGTTAQELETRLVESLDIASQWNAVLLLDEADIYMEKRTSNGDPNRIAMTAIFLRLLEYYRGVLFLTTNRVASFDDAFCSRISMFLRYHRLAGAQKDAVWASLLGRAGIQNPDLTQFNDSTLNGREIRNTIRIAQTWAKGSGVELTTDHVLQVVKMLGEFRSDLEGAISEEPEERSFSKALAKVRSLKSSNGGLNGNFVSVSGGDQSSEEAY